MFIMVPLSLSTHDATLQRSLLCSQQVNRLSWSSSKAKSSYVSLERSFKTAANVCLNQISPETTDIPTFMAIKQMNEKSGQKNLSDWKHNTSCINSLNNVDANCFHSINCTPATFPGCGQKRQLSSLAAKRLMGQNPHPPPTQNFKNKVLVKPHIFNFLHLYREK